MYTLSTADRILVEQGILTHQGILRAYEEKSPQLAEFICKLLILDPAPRNMFIEQRRGTPTFKRLHAQIEKSVHEKHELLRSLPKNRISKTDILEYTWKGHQTVWEHLSSDVMAPLLPERVHLNAVIYNLWNDRTPYAREQLLLILREARLLYGVWRAIKKIFKEAERRYDWEVYAILIDRFTDRSRSISVPSYAMITEADQAEKIAEVKALEAWGERKKTIETEINTLLNQEKLSPEEEQNLEALYRQQEEEEETKPELRYDPSVVNWNNPEWINRDSYWSLKTDSSIKTRAYLRRRALRTLFALASDLPDAYPAAAAEIVVRVSESFGRQLLYSHEALWARHMPSLLKIVEEAPHEKTVKWAYDMLKKYFRLELKTIDGDWLYRVSQSKIESTRAIALQYLEEETGVGRGLFHEHGYHKTIIAFLGLGKNMPTHSTEAQDFALIYLRGESVSEAAPAIVEELSLDDVCVLLKKGGKFKELGEHLLNGVDSKSPYEDKFSLDFFSSLLEDSESFSLAETHIKKRYTGTDLKAAWYGKRLLSKLKKVRLFALQLLQDPTKYSKEDDWTQFCLDILHHLKADAAIYEEAFRRLTAKDSTGRRLLDDRSRVPLTFIRYLLLHPQEIVVSRVLSLIEERAFSVHEIGLPFLKTIATRREFASYYQQADAWKGPDHAGDFINDTFLLHLKDKKEAAHHASVGKKVRNWLVNEFSMQAVGLVWCHTRLEWWSTEYQFVRELFSRDVTFAELAGLLPNLTIKNPTTNLHVRGAQQVAWFVYDKCLDAGSKKANFYKQLLLSRNPRYRQHKNILSALSAEQIFPQEAFDFDWFLRWAKSKRAPIRAYAIDMARYEMSHWLSPSSWERLQSKYTKPQSAFDKIKPLFTGFYDIEKAIKRAIYRPLIPKEHSKIDVKSNPIFEPNSLYRYCFGSDERPRDFALGIIRDFPEKYGRLENLLSLSDSNDAAVRQLVVEVLWKKYNSPITTPGWKPFPYSVVPFNLSRAIDPLRKELDPNTLSLRPEDVTSGEHYLGIGGPEIVEKKEAVDVQTKFELHEFIRRILYTLPRTPAQKDALDTRRSKAETSASLLPSWKNKKTLVIAMRDFALQDKEFALFVLPILEEFQSIRGKLLYEACLSALVQIKHAYDL